MNLYHQIDGNIRKDFLKMEELENVLTTLDVDLNSSNSSVHILNTFIKDMKDKNHTIVKLTGVYFFNQMLVFVFESKMQNGTTSRPMTMITEFNNGSWDEELSLAMGTPCIWKPED